jgi:hypothetical protein
LDWDWDLLVDWNLDLDSVWALNGVRNVHLVWAWDGNWDLDVIWNSLSVNNWDLNNWSWGNAGVASEG